ncbi:MAG TPA: hypothetical protein VHG30_15950 [Microvirga sp.]|nr:hypothetical protein [Microvirga sp.]
MRILLSVLVAAGLATDAAAQQPLTLTVRPSGVEGRSADARTRQALLERRMREADFLFRNICVRCGGRDRPGADAPFDPVNALSPPRR